MFCVARREPYNRGVITSRSLRRPTSLAEALQLLSAQGGRVHELAGQGPAPLLLTAAGDYLDLSRLSARAGIQQWGGWLALGLNNTCAELAHASLIRSQATCLAEAAEQHADAAAHLAAALTGAGDSPDVLLALVALESEVEVANLDAQRRVERIRLPLLAFMKQPSGVPGLPLTLHIAAAGGSRGSALVRQDLAPGMTSSFQAAAACLTLEGGSITAASLALRTPGQLSVPLPAAAQALIGQRHDTAIPVAAERAREEIQPLLPPAAQEPPFYVEISAHLLRRALDRALARALAAADPL